MQTLSAMVFPTAYNDVGLTTFDHAQPHLDLALVDTCPEGSTALARRREIIILGLRTLDTDDVLRLETCNDARHHLDEWLFDLEAIVFVVALAFD